MKNDNRKEREQVNIPVVLPGCLAYGRGSGCPVAWCRRNRGDWCKNVHGVWCEWRKI